MMSQKFGLRAVLRIVWAGLALVATILGGLIYFASEPDMPGAVLEARFGKPPSQFVVLPSGARVHFRDEGDQSLPPLVLLHGAFDSLYTFDAWGDLFKDRFRVVRLDLPGHGLTGPVPDEDYSAAAGVRVVDELMEHLHLNRFALGGNSFGGGIAWRYALSHPEKISSLILIDAAAYPTGSRPFIFNLASQPVLGEMFVKVTPRFMFERTLTQVIRHKDMVTPDMIDRFHLFALREGNRRAGLLRLRQGPEAAAPWQDLPKLSVPCLILWGEQDPWISKSVGERLMAEIPGARLITYPGIGHLPHLEAAAQSAADAGAFLIAHP
jgi:pimeloyl-ACP methyl ester carboxylesterase